MEHYHYSACVYVKTGWDEAGEERMHRGARAYLACGATNSNGPATPP